MSEIQSRKQKQEEETEKNQKKVKWESVTVMGNPCAFLFILWSVKQETTFKTKERGYTCHFT